MPFCPSCGAAVEGHFCAKCGSAVGPAPTASGAPPPLGGAQAPAPAPASAGMEENVACAISYIFIVAIIFLVTEPYNKMKNVRFHSFQSLFYTGACLAMFIGLSIIGVILRIAMPLSMWGIVGLYGVLVWLLYLGAFVLWVLLAVKAYQKEKFVLPIIGPLAEKQA